MGPIKSVMAKQDERFLLVPSEIYAQHPSECRSRLHVTGRQANEERFSRCNVMCGALRIVQKKGTRQCIVAYCY